MRPAAHDTFETLVEIATSVRISAIADRHSQDLERQLLSGKPSLN